MAKSEMRLIVSEQCYLRAQSYSKVRLRMRNFQRFLLFPTFPFITTIDNKTFLEKMIM